MSASQPTAQRAAEAAGLQPVQNVNVASVQRLIKPIELDRELPMSAEAHRTVIAGRAAIREILQQTDDRMLVIVGPCSIHDENAARDYADRLAALNKEVGDRLLLVMRVYFEKPRTTVGWKGLINDPHLDGSFDIDAGLRTARRLLLHICELGLPTATEVLDPITPQYLDDSLCWAAIGARTTESQTHRQMASGLSMPVGYKNSTEGNLQVALDAMQAASKPHAFLGVDDEGHIAIIRTKGNPQGHVILRGGHDRSNFEPDDVREAAGLLEKAGLNTSLMVDCSHANSGKKHEKQQVAWKSVIDQRVAGNGNLVGMMLESNLVEGNQKLGDDPKALKYGVSITDACIGWDETVELIRWAHERLSK
jgi:3-deoxy-7-phosphoheptulonate synthase